MKGRGYVNTVGKNVPGTGKTKHERPWREGGYHAGAAGSRGV